MVPWPWSRSLMTGEGMWHATGDGGPDLELGSSRAKTIVCMPCSMGFVWDFVPGKGCTNYLSTLTTLHL